MKIRLCFIQINITVTVNPCWTKLVKNIYKVDQIGGD